MPTVLEQILTMNIQWAKTHEDCWAITVDGKTCTLTKTDNGYSLNFKGQLFEFDDLPQTWTVPQQ